MDFSTRVDAPLLSIIIPAYNEESRLPATLEEITGFLQKQAYSYEVLIIENGSSDRTLEIAQAFAQRFSFVYAYHETERGKGLAVRAGMLKASGQYRFICDADLSMPISEVNRFIPPLNAHHGVVIASREAPGAVRHNEPHYRHVTGRLFNWVVRILAAAPGEFFLPADQRRLPVELAALHHPEARALPSDPDALARLRALAATHPDPALARCADILEHGHA